MSGTLNNIHNNISFALNLHYEVMARLQEQAYTGSRINRASDDPSAAYRVLGLNSQKSSLENYISNLSNTGDTLQACSTNVMKITESLSKAREILAGITDTDGTIGQAINIEAIDGCLESVVLFANWKRNGQYLFS